MPMLAIKAIGLIVLLALLAGAATWAAKTIHKANGYDAALERVAQVERQKAELAKAFADAAQADVDIAAALAEFRGNLSKDLGKFAQQISAQNLMRSVPRETNEPCRERDPAVYRGLFNQAVTGAPTP